MEVTSSPSTQETSTDRNSVEYLLSGDNGPAGALNKTQASVNLAPNERIFNDTSGFTENNKRNNTMQPLSELNMMENVAEWNASTVKTSMYRNNENPTKLLHPGMLILAVGVLGCAVTLATLAARFNSRKRGIMRNDIPEDIPVSSISSVTELW